MTRTDPTRPDPSSTDLTAHVPARMALRRSGPSRHAAAAGLLTALGLLGACVEPPPPATPAATIAARVVHYTCAGNHRMTVSYDGPTATLAGPEKLLQDDAEGNHFSWPSDGTHHVWALSNGIGTLSLHDGTKGTDTVVQTGCKPDPAAP